jgi:hypothetical protein
MPTAAELRAEAACLRDFVNKVILLNQKARGGRTARGRHRCPKDRRVLSPGNPDRCRCSVPNIGMQMPRKPCVKRKT